MVMFQFSLRITGGVNVFSVNPFWMLIREVGLDNGSYYTSGVSLSVAVTRLPPYAFTFLLCAH